MSRAVIISTSVRAPIKIRITNGNMEDKQVHTVTDYNNTVFSLSFGPINRRLKDD